MNVTAAAGHSWCDFFFLRRFRRFLCRERVTAKKQYEQYRTDFDSEIAHDSLKPDADNSEQGLKEI
jgi:hypothetical protein